MRDFQSKLVPGNLYHIYNRANGSELLFRSAENYEFFLKRYRKYIEPIVETFAYCLMPNHFHFLVRVRDEEELLVAFGNFNKSKGLSQALPKFGTMEEQRGALSSSNPQGLKDQRPLQALPKFGTLEEQRGALNSFISKQFANFFSSYTQAYNKMYKRKGSLFIKNFKRLPIKNHNHLQKVIIYIHRNPVEARMVLAPEDWYNSSYRRLISNEQTWLMKAECIKAFEDITNFKHCHF